MSFIDLEETVSFLRQAGLQGASFLLERLPRQSVIETCPADTQSNVSVQITPAANIYPASMIKVPLAVSVAAALDDQTISSSSIIVQAAHCTQDDAPSPFRIGYQAEIWELIGFMISASNNTATNVLLDLVGRAEATQRLQKLGLRHTRLERYLSGSTPRLIDTRANGENAHPASDAALLFKLIARNLVPFAEKILEALGKQLWNTKLSVGLEPGDTFAHKTGETSSCCHDGGILTTHDGQSYIIVLYTELPANDETDRKFAHFMKLLRPLL